MPQLVNPRQGFIASANNDPIGVSLDNDPLNQRRPGGGIYYLSSLYANGSRVGRITRLLQAELARHGRVSRAAMARIQSDVTLVDAQVLEPFIERAYANATSAGSPPQLAALAADPALGEAVQRLGAWDASTPTGIPEGYDAGDVRSVRITPSRAEVASSVAATIYALWRSKILANTVGATLERVGLEAYPTGYDSSDDKAMVALRHLLDTFPTTRGVGASGLSFFDVPDLELTPEAERDLIILTSLKDALDLAASPAFAPAFAGSTDQDDYRWGKLHRITFSHPLGAPFSIPPGAGFTDLAPDLPGLSTDGGYDTVDFSQHEPRADSLNGFMYEGGASRRFIGDATPRGIRATEVIAGGESGEPTDPTFGNQLGLWLTNEAHPTLATRRALPESAASTERFMPVR
jgi:penicillin G amidase